MQKLVPSVLEMAKVRTAILDEDSIQLIFNDGGSITIIPSINREGEFILRIKESEQA